MVLATFVAMIALGVHAVCVVQVESQEQSCSIFCECTDDIMDCTAKDLTDWPFTADATFPSVSFLRLAKNRIATLPVHELRHNFPKLLKLDFRQNELPCRLIHCLEHNKVHVISECSTASRGPFSENPLCPFTPCPHEEHLYRVTTPVSRTPDTTKGSLHQTTTIFQVSSTTTVATEEPDRPETFATEATIPLSTVNSSASVDLESSASSSTIKTGASVSDLPVSVPTVEQTPTHRSTENPELNRGSLENAPGRRKLRQAQHHSEKGSLFPGTCPCVPCPFPERLTGALPSPAMSAALLTFTVLSAVIQGAFLGFSCWSFHKNQVRPRSLQGRILPQSMDSVKLDEIRRIVARLEKHQRNRTPEFGLALVNENFEMTSVNESGLGSTDEEALEQPLRRSTRARQISKRSIEF